MGVKKIQRKVTNWRGLILNKILYIKKKFEENRGNNFVQLKERKTKFLF